MIVLLFGAISLFKLPIRLLPDTRPAAVVAGSGAALAICGLFNFQALDLLTMIGFIILPRLVVNAAILPGRPNARA